MAKSWQITWPESNVAVLTFDLEGKAVNVLSRAVLEELEARLTEIAGQANLAGLVIRSGKLGTFAAGADLFEFASSLDASREEVIALCRRGQTLFRRLSELPCPTVAAIDGLCLGGGAELAIWCDRRILATHPKTEIGFPEVKLGLFPGWGGTARLPRMIGLAGAVEMITSGESLSPQAAAANGLACDTAASERLLDAAIHCIRLEQKTKDYLRDRKLWAQPIAMSETEREFLGATAGALIQGQTKGHYPAPGAALELMCETATLPLDEALAREAEEFSRVFGSPVNRALLNVFFLTERNKKDSGLAAGARLASLSTSALAEGPSSVTVVGAGIMGAGIAAACIKRGLPVILDDASPEALAKGVKQSLAEASYQKRTGGPDAKRLVECAPLIRAVTTPAELCHCPLVIEAIVENPEAKQALYAQIEPHLDEDSVLATNTSTIPISQLASKLARPDRFCGIHFFNPVRRMKLVEVIRGEQTSDATIARAVGFARRIGKSPIVVKDGPGFLVNRLLTPYLNESIQLIREGASLRQIDRAATGFGMPIGPIGLYDVVGLDTAVYCGLTMWNAFPDRIVASPLLPALVKAGRLGQKSGAGFYSYRNRKQRAEDDPETARLIESYLDPPRKFSSEELTQRLFLPMLLEATRILSEGLVRDPRDVDLGLIFGLGFPPFRGGLLYWADTLGAGRVVEMLKPFEALGERYRPTPRLLEMANRGETFYPRPAK